ncbi:hypothetical protein DYD21_06865 [Rhodohalobacter sp. SW132]|uniref:peptidylprolyl isomerase n=1 Tax=Rhodohalobacter sp. SW132 TaxID=2293433 RepID=UPI000E230988|nr:peptidylprolyl isomerase [Rhodohalobacter sp. SW132]REL38321.1 hypothetical protein DYD21_06865 [Rhodohalobacter sp. SW132]
MNRIHLFALLLAAAFLSSACSSTSNTSSSQQPDPEDIVATIGNQPVLIDDLISYYERNNMETDYTVKDLREFLPYYVEYKLKLAYGEKNGMLEDPEILSEYETYSRQAALSYWLENEIRQSMVDQFIERSRYELKSSHVLIQLNENSRPHEVEEALVNITEARDKFLNGEATMEELDADYSSRVQGRSVGGDLPWFSAGVTVKPFEDVLFSLEPGELSEPVRTQFGYHIIYLEEKRERTPDRMTSHIFFRSNRDNLSAEELSNQAYEALQADESWNDVVTEYSQDGASANRGGEIGWVGYGSQFAQDFVETVIAINPDLPFSEPIQTDYGYHIFKIDSVRTFDSEEQLRDEFTERFRDLPRASASREQVFEHLADIGQFTLNDDTSDQLRSSFSAADTTSLTQMNLSGDLRQAPLVSFEGQTYTTGDFLNWLIETDSNRRANNFSAIWFDLYENHIIEEHLVKMTREHFEDFDDEIAGFLNGLVVFQISDDNIWNAQTADTTALQAYFEENRENYQFGERYDYTMVSSTSDSTLQVAMDRIRSGENPLDLTEEFERLFVARDSVASPAEEIIEQIDQLSPGEISEAFRYRNRNSHLIFNQMLEPRQMAFDEAFYRVSSDYQPVREEQFLAKLRDEFPVETFPQRIRLSHTQ